MTPKTQYRFGIKTLLFATLFVAFLLVAIPKLQHYLEWREERIRLESWAAQLKREQGNVEVYWCLTKSLDSPKYKFAVLTAKPRIETIFSGEKILFIDSDCVVDSHRFFVTPPGKWVDTVDEVIDQWDYHHKRDVTGHPKVIWPSSTAVEPR